MMSVRMPRRHRQSNLCECLGEIGVDVVSTVAEDQDQSDEACPDLHKGMCNNTNARIH